MALKSRPGEWLCSVCHKKYPDSAKADACRDSHNLIYVPLTLDELNRIVNFIFIKEDSLMTEQLVKKLSKYLRRG